MAASVTDLVDESLMDKILRLIKFFKEEEFADKFLKLGQVYFNVPIVYNESTNNEQGDVNEGAEWIDNTPILSVKVEHPTIGTIELKAVTTEPSKVIQYNYYYLSFSLFALTPDLFDENDSYKMNPKIREFGETAVVIREPNKFLKSLTEELKSKNIRYEISLVNYRDLSSGRVDVNPFDKKQEHQHQCELRIIIENTENTARSIDIGSMEQYSKIVASNLLTESPWTIKQETKKKN